MKSLYVTIDRQIFISPDSAIISRGNPWFLPDDAPSWKGKVLLGTCITRLGMHIAEKFANRYYQNFIAAVHTYSDNAEQSVRWSRDGALVTGAGVVPASSDGTLNLVAAGSRYDCDANLVREKIDSLIAYVSKFITLKTGDLILFDTGINDFDINEGFDFDVELNDTHMLHFKTR